MKKALFLVGVMLGSAGYSFGMDKEIDFDAAFEIVTAELKMRRLETPKKIADDQEMQARQAKAQGAQAGRGVTKPHGQRDAKAPQRQVRKKLNFDAADSN